MEDDKKPSGVAEIKQSIQSLYDELKSSNAQSREEIKKFGNESAETKEHFEKLNDRFDALEAKWQRIGVNETEASVAKADNEVKSAFNEFLRVGDLNKLESKHYDVLKNHNVEMKALSSDKLAEGGAFATDEFLASVIEKQREYDKMRMVATVRTISNSDGLLIPRRTGDSTANWEGERETNANTGTPAVDRLRIPVHRLAARPQISSEELADARIDVASFLQNDVAAEFAEMEGTAFINGNGVDKPEGVLQASGLQNIDSGSNTAFTADNLIDLAHNIKEPYIPNGVFMLNRTTVGYIRKFAGNDNFYWQPSLGLDNPPTILGHRYFMTPTMAATSSGNFSQNDVAVLFGDFGKGYNIVDRLGMTVLVDPYTQKPFVEYYFRKRVGGQVVQPEAISKLTITT